MIIRKAMKSLFLFFLLTGFLQFKQLLAQTPQGISYQAVARNTAGVPLVNQAIMLRFTVRDMKYSPKTVPEE
jgi:hypothetical protein